MGLALMGRHSLVDLPGYAWMIFFFLIILVNDQVWTKVFLKMNEGGVVILKNTQLRVFKALNVFQCGFLITNQSEPRGRSSIV